MVERFPLMAGVLAVAMIAGARDVALTAFDRDTGAGTVTISAAEQGDGDKTLLAVWAPVDMGNVATNGRETAVLATVAPGDVEKTFTMPARLRTKSGVVRIFLMDGAAPYETRFASIRSVSTGPYIDTGHVPTHDTDISVTAKYPTSSVAPFGITEVFYLFSNNVASSNPNQNAAYFCSFFGSKNSGNSFTAPRGPGFRTHRLNSTFAGIDGATWVMFKPAEFTLTTTSTITLFARKTNDKATLTKQGDIAISDAWIRENGALVHEYVPCRTANGVVTMWDRVTGAACPVLGSGSFEAGDDIGPAPEDCGTAESATEAIRFGCTLEIASRDVATGTVTLNVGEGLGEGRIFALAADADAGTNTVADWSEVHDCGPVAAGATTVTVNPPAAWWNVGSAVRFVWVANDGRDYDRQLEYLHSTGSAYCNTTWIPSFHTEMEIRSKCNVDICSFGILSYFYLFTNGANTYWGFFSQSGNFAKFDCAGGFHTLKLGPSGVYLDGERKAEIQQPVDNTVLGKAMSICFRRSNQDGSIAKNGLCWIEWAKICHRDTLMQDLIPVERGGVVGLYDRRWNKFFAPVSGTGDFSAGPEKNVLTDGAVLAWSEAGSLLSEVSGTWDGGGTDNAFTTAANWDGDVVPDLASGAAVLTFATGGSAAELTESASVRGLVFNAKNDFTIRSANSAAVLSIGPGGIMVQDDPGETISGDWRFAPKFEGRVEVADDQTWDLSSNAKRRINFSQSAVLSGASNRTVTVTGGGVLGLQSTNTFKGSFDLRGGFLKITSKQHPFGPADEGGVVNLYQEDNAKVQLYGATIDKPLVINSTSLNSDCFQCCDNGAGTCTFTAPITVRGLNFALQNLGKTVFAGGADVKVGISFMRDGEVVFEGRPFNVTGSFVRFQNKRVIHFNVASNTMTHLDFNYEYQSTGDKVHFGVDYAFHNWDTALSLGRETTFDLHGHPQNFGELLRFDAGCHITSTDGPAECFVFQNDSNKDQTFSGTFEGELCLSKSGGRTATIAAANTSTGFLNAQNGALVIATNGCWAGTDIRIGKETTNRKPSLRLRHNNCFAHPRETTITMTTSTSQNIYTSDIIPLLNLDEGVNIRVADVVLDGRSLKGGSWGSSQSPAQHKDDLHFAGMGMIRVPGEGSMLIFR